MSGKCLQNVIPSLLQTIREGYLQAAEVHRHEMNC
jgi:hypothetical protein